MTSQVQPISSYSSQMNVGFQNYNSSSYEKSNTNNVNFVSNPVQHYSDNLSVKGNNKWTNRNVNFGSDNSLSNRKKKEASAQASKKKTAIALFLLILGPKIGKLKRAKKWEKKIKTIY